MTSVPAACCEFKHAKYQAQPSHRDSSPPGWLSNPSSPRSPLSFVPESPRCHSCPGAAPSNRPTPPPCFRHPYNSPGELEHRQPSCSARCPLSSDTISNSAALLYARGSNRKLDAERWDGKALCLRLARPLSAMMCPSCAR
jgi:hypothetical protein